MAGPTIHSRFYQQVLVVALHSYKYVWISVARNIIYLFKKVTSHKDKKKQSYAPHLHKIIYTQNI